MVIHVLPIFVNIVISVWYNLYAEVDFSYIIMFKCSINKPSFRKQFPTLLHKLYCTSGCTTWPVIVGRQSSFWCYFVGRHCLLTMTDNVTQVPSCDQHCQLTPAKSMAWLVVWCHLLVLLIGQQCRLTSAKSMAWLVGWYCLLVLLIGQQCQSPKWRLT